MAFVGGLLLAGCGTTGGEVGEPVAGTNAPQETKTDKPAEDSTETPTEEPAATANPKFGETFTYEDGLSVTVSAPEPYTPSDTAATGGEPSFVKFQVTVVNGTSENYDPSLFYVTMQSGNAEAGEVYDSANNLNGSPTTPILPGREGTWAIAFGVTDPNDLVMQVRADMFEREDIIYTS